MGKSRSAMAKCYLLNYNFFLCFERGLHLGSFDFLEKQGGVEITIV
jgi:hypothetical protein